MISSPLLNAIIEYNQLNEVQMRQLESPIPLTVSNNDLIMKAVARIRQAIAKKEKIIVCGDYDCDGLCGSSILVYTLRKLGADVGFYIPNRFEDGYGLHPNTVAKAIGKGYRLFITVDNGVSAFEAIQALHHQQAQVIILDHHERTLDPQADVLVHPDFLEEPYQTLCGSGLAFMVSHHLIGYDPYIAALAGIATIADMMPLWNFNRSLVIDALKQINQERFPQIMILMKDTAQSIDEESLSYQVIPKLNAVGRLADLANPNRLVDFLVSDNPTQIQNLARQIIDINEKRKAIHQSMYATALSMVDDSKVLMLKDPTFHEGVVGITAGKLANAYKRPVIVMHDNGQRLKGSARSYGDIDLRTLFTPGLPFLSRYGGHAAAAGLEMDNDQFEAFQKAVLEGDWPSTNDSSAEALMFDQSLMDLEDWMGLKAWGPFGMGFQIPLFHVDSAQVVSRTKIKGGFKFVLQLGQTRYDSLYFGEDIPMEGSQSLSFLCKVQTNVFRQKVSLNLMIERFA